jgi:tetratricopeptide (TPR) repeat protein
MGQGLPAAVRWSIPYPDAEAKHRRRLVPALASDKMRQQSPWFRRRQSSRALFAVLLLQPCSFLNFVQAFNTLQSTFQAQQSPLFALHAISDKKREMEIRRKINSLRQEGKLKKKRISKEGDVDSILAEIDSDDDENPMEDSAFQRSDDYAAKVRQKLGDKKFKLLGWQDDTVSANDSNDDEPSSDNVAPNSESQPRSTGRTIGQLGKLVVEDEEDDATQGTAAVLETKKPATPWISSDLFDDDQAAEDEEELVDVVAQKLMEKRERERKAMEAKLREDASVRLAKIEQERIQQQLTTRDEVADRQLTSGVGGSWSPPADASQVEKDVYQPKTGSWGAFPRPKDISKAYGGGRRVGVGYTKESTEDEDSTRARLQRYREKVGIEVPSEKEHAAEIEEALGLGQLAMQRGRYSTAVSALEKVTMYCSSNSKVGGKVFLELAMAYEAVGRTREAITVYTTLSKCRIEEIKYNAKRLLYGIEAMEFMRKEVKSPEFSRKTAKNVFIDTTGLANFADNFDDRYQTAYIDLDKPFYRQLTQSVVRSTREARQILLRAVSSEEGVERLRVVQACRLLSRQFDEAMELEVARTARKRQPVAVIDGKPITGDEDGEDDGSDDFVVEGATLSSTDSSTSFDTFVLPPASQMMLNLAGEWRLQLLADRRGDGVKFFNTTTVWQLMDGQNLRYATEVPTGFFATAVLQQGDIQFNPKRRVLRRQQGSPSSDGAGVGPSASVASPVSSIFSGLFTRSTTGPMGAIAPPQQVLLVDSILLITRNAPPMLGLGSTVKRRSSDDDEKDYFAVWRRVETGTYSESKSATMRRTASSPSSTV